jgi:hypothetical protein
MKEFIGLSNLWNHVAGRLDEVCFLYFLYSSGCELRFG